MRLAEKCILGSCERSFGISRRERFDGHCSESKKNEGVRVSPPEDRKIERVNTQETNARCVTNLSLSAVSAGNRRPLSRSLSRTFHARLAIFLSIAWRGPGVVVGIAVVVTAVVVFRVLFVVARRWGRSAVIVVWASRFGRRIY